MRTSRWFMVFIVTLYLTLFVSTAYADTTYTVQPDDSLSKIASRFGTNYLVLAAANDLEEPYIINIGQVLVIPGDLVESASEVGEVPPVVEAAVEAPAPQESAAQESPAPVEAAQAEPGTYRVQAGDSVSGIAKKFGTNYLVIAALNDLEEPYIINLGQVLNVPGGTAAAEPEEVQAAAEPQQNEAVQTAAPAAAAAAPAAPVAAPSYGGGFELGGQTQSFANRELMHDIGMTWVKRQHKWSPGDSPEAVAGLIADAHNSGFKILLSIPGANTYPAPGGIDFNAYVDFLGGVAALGPDAIEVWNEQNIDFEWPAGEIDPTSYVSNMLAPAYNAIKSANPNVLVIGGALAPTGFDNGVNAWADSRYVAGMAAAGAARYMDCIGVHHNSGATSPSATSGHPAGTHYSWYFRPTMDLYYNAFGGATKVCFTELGYVSPEGFPGISPQFGWAADNTVAEHAQWLAEAVRLAQSSGKVRMLIIFNVDFTHYDPNGDPQAGYAIVRPDGSCPACDALGRGG
ncbi:MAG: LysM peptidoglycan-binding domain-containing protein [Candidatus Promineifilaceae bacterium]